MKSKYIDDNILKSHLKKVSVISYLYDKNHIKSKNNKTNVHISVSLTNEYIYPTIVLVQSVLANCNKEKTFLTIHLLCDSKLSDNNLLKLKKFMNYYSSNTEMVFYNMRDLFMIRYTKRFTQACMYKFLTPVLYDVDRIILLDGDCLVLKDLSDMYNIALNDNYVLGILDYNVNGIDYLGIKSEKYINSGVMLVNLEKIREDNKVYDILNLTYSNINNPSPDQNIVNYVFYPKIGIMPTKYIIFNFEDDSDIKIYLNILRTKISFTEVSEALKDPTVIHCVLCWPKMWSINNRYIEYLTSAKQRGDDSCIKYYNLWFSYANKTDYYNEIVAFSKHK